MIELRDYQHDLVNRTRESMLSGKKRPLLVCATGGGKTVMFSYFTQSAINKGNHVLILAHRDELLEQISETLNMFHVKHGYISSGNIYRRDMPAQVGSVMTVVRRLDIIRKPDIIIVDECFIGSTLIDGVRIDALKVGDYVKAWCDVTNKLKYKKIKTVFVNDAPNVLYKVKTKFREVVCTGNHPIYVEGRGWISASKIRKGETVYGLYGLQSGVQNSWFKKVLTLLQKGYDKKKHRRCTRKNEKKESNVQQKNFAKDERKPQKNWPQAFYSRRQWQAINKASAYAVSRIELAYRVCICYWQKIRQWLSFSLQNRYCESRIKNCHRSRWPFSFFNRKTKAGLKETKAFGKEWVESIEVYKQGSDGRFEQVCPDGKVYNIEVDDYHTYFANGMLVHNCHHARKGNTYDKIISCYKDSWVIGVTATPCRLSGEPLNEVFDDLVQGPQTGELIDRGYLCKYKVYAPFKIDVSKIKTRLGDYSATDLDGAINKKAITGNAVDEYIRLLSGKRAVVFCVSVEHAESVAREFSARGIPSASVDGKMNIWDRKRILAAFRDNRIKVITNCNIITEGFDLKELDAVIMLRPTQSLSLYIQMVGRALRISPGKDMAYIIDHVGNVERHGFPCDEREWSLSGTAKNKDKEVSVKTCPNCYAVVKSVVKQCAYCDYKFGGSGGGRQIEQVDGTLEEVEVKRKIASEKVIEQVKAETLEQLYELGVKRGYKHARRWAQHIFNARQAKKLKGSRT